MHSADSGMVRGVSISTLGGEDAQVFCALSGAWNELNRLAFHAGLRWGVSDMARFEKRGAVLQSAMDVLWTRHVVNHRMEA